MSKLGLLILFVASAASAQPGASLPDMPQPPDPGGYSAPPQEPMTSPPANLMPQPQQPQEPVPGSSRAAFVSTNGKRWDVTLDQHPVCTTPCSAMVLPLQFVALHSEEERPIRLDVGYLPGGALTVHAKDVDSGPYAAGVTFTAITGAGLATGVTLTAVGCATDNSAMCTAGIITGIGSAIGLYGSIELMRHSAPRAIITPGGVVGLF